MNVLEFYDKASDREMGLVILHVSGPLSPRTAWLVYKHPDGQWITEREATDDDIGQLRGIFGWPAEDQVASTWPRRRSTPRLEMSNET